MAHNDVASRPAMSSIATKSGRPKKRAADRKKNVIKVGVTDAQLSALEAAADKDGMDLSAFARHWMIERARVLGVEI